MKVHIYSWYGQPLPLGLSGGEQDVPEETIIKLFEQGYDVMLLHRRSPEMVISSRRIAGPDDCPLLAIAPKYMGFKQR